MPQRRSSKVRAQRATAADESLLLEALEREKRGAAALQPNEALFFTDKKGHLDSKRSVKRRRDAGLEQPEEQQKRSRVSRVAAAAAAAAASSAPAKPEAPSAAAAAPPQPQPSAEPQAPRDKKQAKWRPRERPPVPEKRFRESEMPADAPRDLWATESNRERKQAEPPKTYNVFKGVSRRHMEMGARRKVLKAPDEALSVNPDPERLKSFVQSVEPLYEAVEKSKETVAMKLSAEHPSMKPRLITPEERAELEKEPEPAPPAAPTRAEDRLTKSERNRRKRLKERERAQEEAAKRRWLAKQLDRVDVILSGIKKEEKMQATRRAKRRERIEALLAKPRIGGHVPKPLLPEFARPEQISGSIRSAPVLGSLLLDEQRRMEEQVLVEPIATVSKVKKPLRKRPVKFYDRYSHSDRRIGGPSQFR